MLCDIVYVVHGPHGWSLMEDEVWKKSNKEITSDLIVCIIVHDSKLYSEISHLYDNTIKPTSSCKKTGTQSGQMKKMKMEGDFLCMCVFY